MYIWVSAYIYIIHFLLISILNTIEDNDLRTEVNANYTYVHI